MSGSKKQIIIKRRYRLNTEQKKKKKDALANYGLLMNFCWV